MRGHGFRTGDRVEVVDRRLDAGLHSSHIAVMQVGRRGTVTYHRKLRRIGVKWDDDGSTAQIRVRHLRKLTELELLAETT